MIGYTASLSWYCVLALTEALKQQGTMGNICIRKIRRRTVISFNAGFL